MTNAAREDLDLHVMHRALGPRASAARVVKIEVNSGEVPVLWGVACDEGTSWALCDLYQAALSH